MIKGERALGFRNKASGCGPHYHQAFKTELLHISAYTTGNKYKYLSSVVYP